MPWFKGALGIASDTTSIAGGCSEFHLTSLADPTVGRLAFGSWSTTGGNCLTSPRLWTSWRTSGGVAGSGGGSFGTDLSAKWVYPVGQAETLWPGGVGSWTDIANFGAPAGSTMTGFKLNAGSTGGTFTLNWGTYIAVGSQDPVASTEVQCVNPDGSQFAVTSGVPLAGDFVKVPTCAGAAGSQPGAVGKCVTLSAGRDASSMAVQSDNCASSATAKALYPNCVGISPACSYVVRLDGLPCVIGGACKAWASIYSTDPARIQCRYGSYSVPVADCAFLERVYETGTTTGTQDNTDGDPQTWTGPGPAGQPQSQPSTSTGTDPATATQAPPLAVPVPVPGVLTPSEGDCFGDTYGTFNPIQWVLVPIKCAFIWAWVPDPAVVGPAVGDFQTVFASKPPGSLVVGAASVFGSIGSGWSGGCGGAASASFSQPELGHPLQLPCEPSGGGGGSVAFTAMQIALIVATLIYVWHMVAAGISAQATGGEA